MSDPPIAVERATADRLDNVEALLAAADLPHEDVGKSPGTFFVALADGRVVGAGGVETYGSTGLLRSIVVADGERGRGYGTAICDESERYAREQGVGALFLLTTTAADFFGARGFEEVARDDAPPAIRETAEFADLCPASATCMAKDLR